MSKYPIKYKYGKLVKYPKPSKEQIGIPKYYYEAVYDTAGVISLKKLIEKAEERKANPNDVTIDIGDHYLELIIRVPASPEEIKNAEKQYELDLAEWEKWDAATKDMQGLEEQKNKEKRLNFLKTQEQKLKAALKKIEKQKEKL
jgi:hypothetical protein